MTKQPKPQGARRMSDDYNEPQMRLCDQDGCFIPATHTLVWAKQQYYCPVHLQKVLGVAQVMGFPTPSNTLRELTIEERVLNHFDSTD